MTAIIETERLILRKFVMEDYKEVFEFGSNPLVQKYTGCPNMKNLQEAKDEIKYTWFEDYKNYGYGRFATIYKPDNKLIGFAGLKYLPEMEETDLGYRFLPEYWNMGIATEVSKELVKYGFETLKLKRIIGITMQENPTSSKVLEKAGLKHYKIDEYEGDGGAHNYYKIEIT